MAKLWHVQHYLSICLINDFNEYFLIMLILTMLQEFWEENTLKYHMSTNLLFISIYFTYVLLFLYFWSCFTFYFRRGHFLLMTPVYSQSPVICLLITQILSTSLVAVVKCIALGLRGFSQSTLTHLVLFEYCLESHDVEKLHV